MNVGGSPAVVMPAAMRDQIVAHAIALAPRECCGIVSGRSGELQELHELTNLEPGPDRYRVDDAELFRLYQDLDRRGDEVVAIYHSHPTSPAYPSATDVDLAAWADVVYMICSLAQHGQPTLRGFRIVDRAIAELPLIFR